MKRIITICFILIILFLGSCTIKNSTFLDNNKCDPPCWDGIKLGKTTREEAFLLLKGNPEIDKDSIQFSSGDGVFWDAGLSWKFNDVIESTGVIYFHKDKAVFIELFSESGIALSDYFQMLGKPKEVRMNKIIGDGVFITGTINYPDSGLCLEPRYRTNYKNLDFVKIEPSTLIYKLYLFQPGTIPSQTRGICLTPQDPKLIQQWSGYGDYGVYELK